MAINDNPASNIVQPISKAPSITMATPPFNVKAGLAQMLKGGVIMDVVNAEQARIAEEAGRMCSHGP